MLPPTMRRARRYGSTPLPLRASDELLSVALQGLLRTETPRVLYGRIAPQHTRGEW